MDSLGLAWACSGLLFIALALDSSSESTGPIAWMWLGLLGPCLALPVLAMVLLGFSDLCPEALSVPVLPGLTRPGPKARRICFL